MQGCGQRIGERSTRPGDASLRGRGIPQGRGRGEILPGCSGCWSHGAHHRYPLRLPRQGHLRPAAVLTGSYMASEPLILGAVAYDPKVVTIWDGFQAYFGRHGLDFDYVLYTTYERQVEAL